MSRAAATLQAGIALLPLLFAPAPAAPKTAIGIKDGRFTLDGEPAFFLGASYYGALGASEDDARKDLDELRKLGLRWIRVWATWAAFEKDVSAIEMKDGSPREPYLSRLKRLVAECDARSMAVDVTLSRGNGGTGPSRLKSPEAHRRAVETLLSELKDQRNWWLDLSNERNIRDDRFASFSELKDLRARARELDPGRLVTASHAGDASEDDVRQYILEVGVDFLSIHRPRDAASIADTVAKTREYLKAVEKLGRKTPLLFDEPFRRGYGSWEPRAEDFFADLRGSVEGGAAGWCFHNGPTRKSSDGRPRRSFDLRDGRLFEQLDPEERKVLEGVKQALGRPVSPREK